MASTDPSNPAHVAFDNFIQAQSSKEVQRHFKELCTELQINPRDFRSFYSNLKDKLNYWKAKALWTKLDKRACLPEYQQRKACDKNKCLILGAGPCGLRAAIELSLLGAQVLVLEKRLDFSRNNVLHLWPFTIHDLRALGAKKFYGKFCTGALDHISIRQLQLILLKVSLLFGVEVHTGVEFQSLIEPSGDKGWMAKLQPASHPASAYEFDVFISAGGGKFVPEGFKHKELRGKLAIGITANFINRNSAEETQVAEISGVARIYNQKFFQQLLTNTGIDLENIVYYKDDTHYFVMTAKKKSLLSMGVIKKDQSNAEDLLAPTNVDFEALRSYAYKAADFSTGHKLPEMQFAQNHAGQADVAMFDFTCMYRAENASLVRERKGKKLLLALVGDCLVEPFWPLGTGIARGFLGAFDAAWMVRSWGMGVAPLKVVAERESIYQLLSQTTPQNTSKRYSDYTINPRTRYTRVNMSSIHANQVQHLHMVDNSSTLSRNQKKRETHMRQDSVTGLEDLLKWCQKHTLGHKGVSIKDFTHSWRSGLALCALIHHFRPKLIDMSSLEPNNAIHNNQLAVNIIQKELGIPPALSAADLANSVLIDKLSMVLYLTQIRDAFAAKESTRYLPKSKTLNLTTAQAAVFFLSKLKNSSLQRNKETLAAARQTRERQSRMGDEGNDVAPPVCPEMEHSPEPELDTSGSRPNSETCFFCAQRVYALERISAEGKFFHRSCFTCSQCGITLRLGGYIFDQNTGRFYCELHAEEPEQHNGPGITRREDTGGGEDLSSDDYTLSPSDEEFGPDHQSQQKPDRRNPDSEEEDAGTLKRESVKANKPKTEEVHPHVFYPVPKPRHSKQGTSSPQPSPPVAKPRNILLSDPSTPDRYSHTDSRPKLSLRKLQLSVEEKSVLGNLQSFSADSDSETPGGSSSCSSSSMTASGLRKAEGPDGPDEEGYWSGSTAGYMRDRRNRRCFKKREIPAGGQNRVRSKFSPWNLSSPRISRDSRLSVLVTQPGRVETTFRRFPSPSEGVDGDDDDDDDEDDDDEDDEDEYDFLMQENSNYLEKKFSDTEKLELRKMRTLERRAKMSEIQRFREAQSIQRRLDEIEETFRDLEEKGVVLEQTLRGEEGNDGSPEAIDEWIHLVHEKNTLMSEESELMVQSRQLELEDKQSMLDLELRKFMEIQDKTPEQKEEEERILQKIVEVVDMRNSLVSFLEDKRLKELEEQQFLSVVETKRHSTGAQVHWL